MPKLKKKIPVPTEFEEQKTFVDWLELKQYKFTSIPNGTYNPFKNQQRKNYQSGLRKGLPDMLVLAPQGLAFVEMKRTKGSEIDPTQIEWIDALNKYDGVEAKICYGAQQAIEFIESLA